MFRKFEVHRATPSALSELAALNARLAALGEALPAPGAVPVEVIRRNRRLGRGGLPRPSCDELAETVRLAGRARPLEARLFRHPSPDGLYIHVHGGGWVFGSMNEQDLFLRHLSRQTGLEVLSVDYRLAPEAPFPCAIEDVADAIVAAAHRWSWAPLFVGGESAGAHIALCAVIALRPNEGVHRRLRALNLSYGIYDLSMSPSQRLGPAGTPGLSAPHLAWMIEQFTPGMSPEDRRRSDVSPLFADLSDLPPALFTVGARDILLDDTLFLAARWTAAGNATQLAVYPEAAHGFNGQSTAVAGAANRRTHRFLKSMAFGARIAARHAGLIGGEGEKVHGG